MYVEQLVRKMLEVLRPWRDFTLKGFIERGASEEQL